MRWLTVPSVGRVRYCSITVGLGDAGWGVRKQSTFVEVGEALGAYVELVEAVRRVGEQLMASWPAGSAGNVWGNQTLIPGPRGKPLIHSECFQGRERVHSGTWRCLLSASWRIS